MVSAETDARQPSARCSAGIHDWSPGEPGLLSVNLPVIPFLQPVAAGNWLAGLVTELVTRFVTEIARMLVGDEPSSDPVMACLLATCRAQAAMSFAVAGFHPKTSILESRPVGLSYIPLEAESVHFHLLLELHPRTASLSRA